MVNITFRCRAFLSITQQLIPALEQVLDAEAEVSEVDRSHDVNGWRQEVATLTLELNDLMSRGTPAKSGGAGGAKSGGHSSRTNAGGGSSNGKRGSSGGASGGRPAKKKKGSEGAAATPRGRPAKRPRRSG